MAARHSWRCEACGHHSTLSAADRSSITYTFASETCMQAGEGIWMSAGLIKCPNAECGSLDFRVYADIVGLGRAPNGTAQVKVTKKPAGIGAFQFLPAGGTPLSSYVPDSVRDDYAEAHLIRALSPKASATLSRRALQGMIRDFWGISLSTLSNEIKAIEEKCDPVLYQALNGLRSIGNIGAHPERDVNTIVDIEPGEAEQLLELLRLLDEEWYVARAQRDQRLQKVLALKDSKAAAAKGAGVPGGLVGPKAVADPSAR